MRQGPLAGRYSAVAAMVMAALIPYLALSAALQPITPIIAKQLDASLQTLSLGSGLANAAYAVGTVLAVQLGQHLPQRRMLVGYAVLLVIGSVLTAVAQNAPVFIVGHVIQGLCTSLLLIAAVPPLAIGYPADKLRRTAVILNMCIFGAVALGPLVGGVQASADAWRPLFWIVAGVAAFALLLAVLTFDDAPAANPDAPTDVGAIGLAVIGCFAAFVGASQLLTHPFVDVSTLLPLLGGLAAIVLLITYQFRAKNPLLTVRALFTSTMPVAGLVVALFAAAASVSATALTAALLVGRYSPIHLGLLYVPELAGAIITAIALGVVFNKRAMHFLPLFGMIALAAGIAIFLIEVPSSAALTLVGSGLTGLGLGATVAPALFVAGFSLPSANLQRVFAIVELMRAVAAFMIAPIFAHFAATVGGGIETGTRWALWIGLALALGGAAIGVLTYALGGARPERPDIDRFLAGRDPAWYSPPLLAKVRRLGLTGPPPRPALRTDMASTGAGATNGSPSGPILFAYDGDSLSRLAIEEAGQQLTPGLDALVLTVWQPADVGFLPVTDRKINAADAGDVSEAARETAAQGAALAEQAGFRPEPLTIEGAPTWEGIVRIAEERDASLIVIGSHRRTGISRRLLGSVASAVVARAPISVLVVHEHG